MKYQHEVHDCGYYAKMVCDSIANNKRICSIEIKYPRFVLPQINTHRMISKSSASSRAMPTSKLINNTISEPAMPLVWGENNPGMQSFKELNDAVIFDSIEVWKNAAQEAAFYCEKLADNKVHKQIANRVLDPYLFVKTILTATEWDNFFKLRLHEGSQPEIQHVAKLIHEVMSNSTPTQLKPDEWHLPYVNFEEIRVSKISEESYYDWNFGIKLSSARCARVSYLNHDKRVTDIENDLRLFEQLNKRPCEIKGIKISEHEPKHESPIEHQAKPIKPYTIESATTIQDIFTRRGVTHLDSNLTLCSGNFKDWIQARHWGVTS